MPMSCEPFKEMGTSTEVASSVLGGEAGGAVVVAVVVVEEAGTTRLSLSLSVLVAALAEKEMKLPLSLSVVVASASEEKGKLPAASDTLHSTPLSDASLGS